MVSGCRQLFDGGKQLFSLFQVKALNHFAIDLDRTLAGILRFFESSHNCLCPGKHGAGW